MDEIKDKRSESIKIPPINNSIIPEFFKDKKCLLYLYKKTEKLSAAIHLLTSFLRDDEPLCLNLKRLSLSLINNILSDKINSDIEHWREEINRMILEILSLLDVAVLSGSISNMNFEIISNEYMAIVEVMMDNAFLESMGTLSITNNFFDIGVGLPDRNNKLIAVVKSNPTIHRKDNGYKGQKYKSNNVLYKNSEKVSDSEIKRKNRQTRREFTVVKENQLKTKLEGNRTQVVTDIIKNQGEVAVKDVARFLNGVSEKTIQRQLVALVESGVLKKTGERRWSKYSMNIS